jgi:hypothetical protein
MLVEDLQNYHRQFESIKTDAHLWQAGIVKGIDVVAE